jgi:hypothetical protein
MYTTVTEVVGVFVRFRATSARIPNAISPEAEVPTLDQWIMEKSGI